MPTRHQWHLLEDPDRVMLVHATPNMNGNTPEDFVHAAQRLRDAYTAVEEALANIRSNVFHGRNYQTYPHTTLEPRRKLDSLLMEHAAIHSTEIRRLADAIAMASGKI